MAVTGDWEMRAERLSSTTVEHSFDLFETANKHFTSRTFGMANGLVWIKHRKSSLHKLQLISSASIFIHWSLKIPICDGYHEFL
ncbi:hypothetical protein RND81_02G246700 [Saponaria officinalis]|uniref:Uncharacterized protein n=1 Tax=Saponaria officinalis TaxID=3572 RepID=A0AAW1MZZ0_SAPOF